MTDRLPDEPRSRAFVMEDVARLAGVSAMTVSRVLNTPEKVRAATRARVLDAVRTLGYRPNPAARVLATGRSGVLGVISLDSTLYGPVATLYGIERAARAHDYLVTVASLSVLTHASIGEAVDRLRAQPIDGVVVVAPHTSTTNGLHGLSLDLPAVVVTSAATLSGSVVAVDQVSGAARATRHLLDLGHRTVWHVAGPAEWFDASGRIEGWRSALTARGRQIPQPVIGDWSAQGGYKAGRLLASDPEVTAIFAANDHMAMGVLRALREAGRRVPEDMSVIGFDDVPEAAYFWPPLTTLRPDFSEVGRNAFQQLLERINGRQDGSRVIVEPQLIVRESTGPRGHR